MAKFTYRFHVGSEDFANYFKHKDSKVKFNGQEYELIDADDTNQYALDCYNTPLPDKVSYTVHWVVNENESDVGDVDSNSPAYKKWCEVIKQQNVNGSSPFAMMSDNWIYEDEDSPCDCGFYHADEGCPVDSDSDDDDE